MPIRRRSKGRLIAIDALRGVDISLEARRMSKRLAANGVDAGVSMFDASGIFFGLLDPGSGIPALSPRTLVLLYASDLAFRLRWEILPALEEDRCVIAAPYLEMVLAFGTAAGLSRKWLRNVFNFAPRPDESYRLGGKRQRRIASSDGFLEFCCGALDKSSTSWNALQLLSTASTVFKRPLRRRRNS